MPHLCYQQARMTRDIRFDGLFFIAVKTTKIYCRPICPAPLPKEKNVEYYMSAIAAATAGYRPCLRCRPDSAPGSPSWKGVHALIDKAVSYIDQGALQTGNMAQLCDRLGISERYLRKLFSTHLGVSPKTYALYQQCLFAKKLLHQTNLSITDIAFASGFQSIRRFNDCFQSHLGLAPGQLRKKASIALKTQAEIKVNLAFRPPYNWPHLRDFLQLRAIENMEKVTENSYCRSFHWRGTGSEIAGYFQAEFQQHRNCFDVRLQMQDLRALKPVIHNIKRILDLDVDIQTVEKDLSYFLKPADFTPDGKRLPGLWSTFEAGIRAILGQQISVKAAHMLCTTLVSNLGANFQDYKLFPTPYTIAHSDLDFLKMPGRRKQTLKDFAAHFLTHPAPEDPIHWISVKGVGPWTCDYARLRGLSDPDIYLGGDLGVQKAIQKFDASLNPDDAAPWRSYLTFYLWTHI